MRPFTTAQNFTIKLISGQPRLTHSNLGYKKLKSLPVELLYTKQLLNFYRRNPMDDTETNNKTKDTRQSRKKYVKVPKWKKMKSSRDRTYYTNGQQCLI